MMMTPVRTVASRVPTAGLAPAAPRSATQRSDDSSVEPVGIGLLIRRVRETGAQPCGPVAPVGGAADA